MQKKKQQQHVNWFFIFDKQCLTSWLFRELYCIHFSSDKKARKVHIRLHDNKKALKPILKLLHFYGIMSTMVFFLYLAVVPEMSVRKVGTTSTGMMINVPSSHRITFTQTSFPANFVAIRTTVTKKWILIRSGIRKHMRWECKDVDNFNYDLH